MKPPPPDLDSSDSPRHSHHKKVVGVMAIMGIASIASIFIGVLRLKFVAVFLGPAGIGLYGIYLAIMNSGIAFSGLGFNFAGVKQVAEVQERGDHLSDVRWALNAGNLILGTLACCALWILREPIAFMVFQNKSHATEVGLVGAGVLMALMAGSQLAILQGLRRVRLVAWHKIIGSLITTICGVAIVYYWRVDGIIALVLIMPAANLVVSWFLISKSLPRKNKLNPAALAPLWKKSFSLGVAAMGTANVNALSIIAIQAIIVRYGSQSEVGLFHAVLTLSMHYIGFLLLSSQSDYYPRLTAVNTQPRRINNLVNQQTELGLLVAAPIFILTVALADWVLPLLYSSKFAPAADMLRLWVLGDILTVATIAVAYVLVVLDKGKLFFATKLAGAVVYVGISFYLQKSGFDFTGIAIAKVAMELLVLVVTSVMVASLTGFRWQKKNIYLVLVLLACVIGIKILATFNPLAANITGLITATGFGYFAFRKITKKLS